MLLNWNVPCEGLSSQCSNLQGTLKVHQAEHPLREEPHLKLRVGRPAHVHELGRMLRALQPRIPCGLQHRTAAAQTRPGADRSCERAPQQTELGAAAGLAALESWDLSWQAAVALAPGARRRGALQLRTLLVPLSMRQGDMAVDSSRAGR